MYSGVVLQQICRSTDPPPRRGDWKRFQRRPRSHLIVAVPSGADLPALEFPTGVVPRPDEGALRSLEDELRDLGRVRQVLDEGRDARECAAEPGRCPDWLRIIVVVLFVNGSAQPERQASQR